MSESVNYHKELTKLSKEITNLTRECKTKDDLRTINDEFLNIFVNYQNEYRKKLDNLEHEERQKLETMEQIKELLNK